MGRPALLRIEQTSDGANVTLRASGVAVASWPEDDNVIWEAPRATVDAANHLLSASLVKLLDELGKRDQGEVHESGFHLGEYVRALNGYWDKSDTSSLKQHKRRTELGKILTTVGAEIVKHARNDPLQAAQRAPIVELVMGRQSPVPIEILPLGPRARAGDDLFDVCTRLPAFSCVLQQLFYGPDVAATDSPGHALLPQGAVYEPRGRAFLRSTETKLWEKMRDCLSHHQPPLVLDPAPAHGLLDTREKVARYLLEPNDRDQVQPVVSDIHVYAHGREGTGFIEPFKIDFRYQQHRGFGGRREFSVRTLDLSDAIELARERAPEAARPLIWLNCCTAAGNVGKELFSVSVDLARHGCAVIAPRTEVPEGFAVGLAEQFYTYLGVHPVPGEAFLAARLAALCGKYNPLGLLYVGLGRLV